jgi:hypothetical protein
MKKWSVWGNYYASKFLGEVEAETEEEALKLAEDDAGAEFDYMVCLCHQCADEVEIGDLDSFFVSPTE